MESKEMVSRLETRFDTWLEQFERTAHIHGHQGHLRGDHPALDLEVIQMRLPAFVGIQFVFWTAFYALLGVLKDERFMLMAFVVVLVVSMVTTAVYMAGDKK